MAKAEGKGLRALVGTWGVVLRTWLRPLKAAPMRYMQRERSCAIASCHPQCARSFRRRATETLKVQIHILGAIRFKKLSYTLGYLSRLTSCVTRLQAKGKS